jgi:hypothetical protein
MRFSIFRRGTDYYADMDLYPECLLSTIGISKIRDTNSQYGIYTEAKFIKRVS